MTPRRSKSTVTKKYPNSKKAQKNAYSSHWLKAVANYVELSQTNILDLKHRHLGTKEIRSVLNFLSGSAVTELNLEGNRLTNGMADLVPLFIKTKIKNLKISTEHFTKKDLFQLLKVLKDTQITELNCGQVFDLNSDDQHRFFSHLQKSKLTMLTDFEFFPNSSRLREFLNSSITCLYFATKLDAIDLTLLFSNLSHSLITDLKLTGDACSSETLQELSRTLAETGIEKLCLYNCNLNDNQLKSLVSGLVNSKVFDFRLQVSSFPSLRPIFTILRKTQIKKLNLYNSYSLRDGKLVLPNSLRYSSLVSLNLSYSALDDETGEELVESLRFSNVAKLNIQGNCVGSLTVKKFAENIKDINLIDLNILCNPLSLDAFFILGKCLKESKLSRIRVSFVEFTEGVHFFTFLKLVEGSSISRLEINFPFCGGYPTWDSLECREPQSFKNATLTELVLKYSYISDNISTLMKHLKYSSVSHLDLSCNKISDYGATALAKSLKDTQIRKLNLNVNSISSQGAKALALSLKNTNLLYLHLNANQIEDDGLESLAEHAKDLFVTELDVLHNPGKRVLLVDKVLWQNKISVHRLKVFNQIAPQTGSVDFRFDPNSDDPDVGAFLEKCMWFYKTIISNPRSINVLLEEKSNLFSREQIFTLVSEKFPRQFGDFIARGVEANLTEHVRILEKAEEMGLAVIVESLLLNRPLYLLDERQGILHPRVYRLLLKYKQPICNLAVEPHGVTKIIEHFIQHPDIEGVQDLISSLRDAKISDTF